MHFPSAILLAPKHLTVNLAGLTRRPRHDGRIGPLLYILASVSGLAPDQKRILVLDPDRDHAERVRSVLLGLDPRLANELAKHALECRQRVPTLPC